MIRKQPGGIEPQFGYGPWLGRKPVEDEAKLWSGLALSLL